ncbi:MPPbeta [Symbiodinium pilosum]|uniref:MPPbeta protein n=1 Tax=Symbiodinium pilosum TaxID=2952 RepID=A0A812TK33_SYMPI|nr:MPPbeta [Symbiodinium pilosum]
MTNQGGKGEGGRSAAGKGGKGEEGKPGEGLALAILRATYAPDMISILASFVLLLAVRLEAVAVLHHKRATPASDFSGSTWNGLQLCSSAAELNKCSQFRWKAPAIHSWFGKHLGFSPQNAQVMYDDTEHVIQTLQRIRQPVVGVATASVCHEATEVLQRCDYVLSSDDASFWLKERCISAAEAVAQGVAQRILPVADIGWEMAMLAKQLQVMTAAELASIKVNWLCAKASQVLTSPIKAQQPADSDRFAGTEVLLARPDVAKKESRSFWRSLTASTIPEIDEDEEAEEEEDEGMSSTASACSQATRSFTGDSAMTSADTGALQHDLPISAAWQADPCKLPSKFLSVPNDIVKQIFQAMSKAMSVSFGFYQGKRKTFQAAALGSSACRDRFFSGRKTNFYLYSSTPVRDETKETRGATYLLEQLSLAGTAKRPMAKLESEIESLGATLDLSYGREHSAFNMTMFKGDLAQGVDILADMVTAPAFGNLAKEKQAILRKLEDAEQPTRQVIDDRLHACAFRDYSLGFSTVGPFEGIETLTQDHLKKHHETNFTADKMVIAASGAVKHEELVKLAEKAFGGVKAGPPRVYSTKPYFCGAQLLYRNDEMGPLAYISTGWEAVPWKSPDAVTFMVMQAIIGTYKKNAGLVPGSISGNRVTNAVANKMGVGCAEEYECFMHFYKDTGVFGWYIVCDEVAVEHAVGELMFGCNLLSFSVTDEEVERAKRELKATLVNGSGSTRDSCNQVGKEVLAYGRGVPPAEMMLRIDGVDAEEVKRVAYKYLNDQEISVTALGPLHGMPELYIMRQATTNRGGKQSSAYLRMLCGCCVDVMVPEHG